MDHILVRLPIPISVNKAYAGTARRYRSKEYLEWIDHADLIMNRHGQFKITGDSWLLVEYVYDMPLFYQNGKKKVQDVANYEKVLSDFLTKRIPGFEDHKIKKMFLEKTDGNTNYVTVRIYEIQEQNGQEDVPAIPSDEVKVPEQE